MALVHLSIVEITDLTNDFDKTNHIGMIIRHFIFMICTHLIDEFLGTLSMNGVEHLNHMHLVLLLLFDVDLDCLFEDDLLYSSDSGCCCRLDYIVSSHIFHSFDGLPHTWGIVLTSIC